MKNNRYNIALIPENNYYDLYIKASVENFESIAAGYLLGKNSFPHITLVQFSCNQGDIMLADIKKWLSLTFTQPLYPEFIGLNINDLDGKFEGRYAADLNVAREKDLLSTQLKCLEFVKKNGLDPLNLQGNLYRPHLTLAMFDLQNAINIAKIPNHLFGVSTHPFYVKLGFADDNWQFIDLV